MDVLEFIIVRFFLVLSPFIIIRLFDSETANDMEFWWLMVPSLWSILFSTFLPHKIKWVLRYVTPCYVSYLWYDRIYNEPMELVKASHKHKNYMLDCFGYINYKIFLLFLLQLCGEVMSIMSIIVLRLYRFILKYGGLRTLMYIILCTINAFVFVYLLQYLFMILNHSHYLKPSDISVSVEANHRNFDVQLPELQTYEKHESFQMYTNSNLEYSGSFATINGIRAPVCRKMYFRMPGEDIDIYCCIRMYNSTILLYGVLEDHFDYSGNIVSYFWMRSKERVKPSTKHKMFMNNGVYHYKITSLEKKEFDREISLWVELRFINLKQVLYLKVGYFFIHLQKTIEHFVHIPNGHILYIQNLHLYAEATSEDVVMFQNVSSIVSTQINGDISTVCRREFEGCSPFVHHLYNKTYSREINSIYVETLSNELLYNSLSCICKNSFGKHTFVVQRFRSINSTSTYIEEINLPYVFVVLPIGLTQFSRSKYEKLRNDVIARMPEMKDWRWSFQFFVNDEVQLYYYIHKFEKVVVFIYLCDICMLFVILIKLYNILFVRQVAKMILVAQSSTVPAEICPSNIANICCIAEIKYEIMIIYNDEDYELVKLNLVPFFENRDLSVFIIDRDMTPGSSKVHAYSMAVQSCRVFVVIGSNHFLQDQWNNEFVLGDLVVPLIHERNGHHVILIKWNDVEVPLALRWDPKVSVIKWSNRRSLSDNLLVLRNDIRLVPCIGRHF